MKKALVIINTNSGGYVDAVRKRIEEAISDYLPVDADIDADIAALLSAEPFDLLVVAGGDGTLSSVLNKIKDVAIDILYVPCGTLNERAKARTRFAAGSRLVLGTVNEHVFTYVTAAGSFTPIGYVTDVRNKKRLGRFAYFAKVLREYKVHSITAQIVLDGVAHADEYTLIMVIKCDRCFGFRFNKMYDSEQENGHILLIKSPKNKRFWGKICIFFPFFRAFFMGFRKPYHSKSITFEPFEEACVTLYSPCDFDVDGEKSTLDGNVDISFKTYPASFDVLDKKQKFPS